MAQCDIGGVGPVSGWAILMRLLLYSAGWILIVPFRATVGHILVKAIVVFALALLTTWGSPGPACQAVFHRMC